MKRPKPLAQNTGAVAPCMGRAPHQRERLQVRSVAAFVAVTRIAVRRRPAEANSSAPADVSWHDPVSATLEADG
jgi:hypothetical protein